MRYIRQIKQISKASLSRVGALSAALYKRPILLISVAVLLVSALYIAIMAAVTYAMFDDTTYPRFVIGNIEVGGVPFDELHDRLQDQVQQTEVTFVIDDAPYAVTAGELGIQIDNAAVEATAAQPALTQRLAPWHVEQSTPLPLLYDESQANQVLSELVKDRYKAPTNASFAVEDNTLVITEGTAGLGIDTPALMEELTEQLSSTVAPLTHPTELSELAPTIQSADIEALQADILAITARAYGWTDSEAEIMVRPAEVASWLEVVEGENAQPTVTVSEEAIAASTSRAAQEFAEEPVNQVTTQYKSGKAAAITTPGKKGRQPSNSEQVARELYQQVREGKDYTATFTFTDLPFEERTATVDDTVQSRRATYTYSVAVWGTTTSDLATFKAQAAQTLASQQGWAASGVTFQEVASGGNFTLVLAEPARVKAAAPSVCSTQYSCRVGRNVIINDDRWSSATPSWNSAGGNLRDYRHMVINHEVGHWLGMGHRSCPASGTAAPVMMQQSISLGGCRFNPWPTSTELSAL